MTKFLKAYAGHFQRLLMIGGLIGSLAYSVFCAPVIAFA
jgi:hypothetical protein